MSTVCRTMWHVPRRASIDIGREQTARLMRLAGVAGKGKAQDPNTLWVTDITSFRTKKRCCVRRVCHCCVFYASSDKPIRFHAHRSIAAASSQPGDRVRRGKQQVWCTILTTAHTMSALSTTSSFPNTGLVFASELSATHINITRLSLKTFTVLTKTSSTYT